LHSLRQSEACDKASPTARKELSQGRAQSI